MAACSGSGAGSPRCRCPAPTREVGAAALVVLVAVVAWRAGGPDRTWDYLAAAAALLPPLVVDALVLTGHRPPDPTAAAPEVGAVRRSRPLLAAAAFLAATGPALLVLGHAAGPALASLCGAAGISFAAGPTGPRKLGGNLRRT